MATRHSEGKGLRPTEKGDFTATVASSKGLLDRLICATAGQRNTGFAACTPSGSLTRCTEA